jgi:DNA gyrase subunit A
MAIEDRNTKKTSGIVQQSISKEMRDSYLDYAMSVITARALPDVRDGLKPVHRRILFAMHGMGLTIAAKTRKSAAIVGEVLGKYHPHGNLAVYEAMVKMAQLFSMRYPLVIGQGNFGSVDGDPAAAERYTEAKMSQIASELLRDLDKETVEWNPNYENTRKEPSVLPAALPNLLLNGTLGIAVGMATNIPPHNLGEVVDATIHLIENKDATTEDLLSFVKGPDFPTAGLIFGAKDIRHAYAGGKGGIVVRGVAEITEDKKGSFQIIVTSLPYRVNKADLLVKIAALVRDKKLDGIRDLRDESTDDVRVVVELKSGAHPQKILNYLYKHTALEDTFHLNMVALVDGVPQTLSLKGVLENFIAHRIEVVRRRTEFDLKRAREREHILSGLSKALDHIDAIIKLIKSSRDVASAHAGLRKSFSFSDRQATAILEMRLQKLAGLERKKIENELREVRILIKKLETILGSKKKVLDVVKEELSEATEKYGDDRRTKVIKTGVKSISDEDLIPDESSALVLTQGGYIKRTNPDEYKKQRRGGVGVIDINTKEEDIVTKFLVARTHNDLLFFSDRGKVYQIKMYDVPEGKRSTKGKSVMNFLSLSQDERITSVLAMPADVKQSKLSLLMVTKSGIAKKVAAENFHDVRRSGLIAIRLSDGDELISAQFVAKGDTAMLATAGGQAIRFAESDIREMGRNAAGVRAIKLGKGDMLISANIVSKDDKESTVLVVSKKGYGKQTDVNEYKIQKRGGSGIKTANVTDKTGQLISSRIVSGDDCEIVAISQKGQVIRLDIKDIPRLGRQTQGVRIMKLRATDKIASLVCL